MDREEIHQLIIEEIAGNITPANKEYLYQVIADDKEAFALWQDLHSVLHPEKVAELRAGFNMEQPSAIIHSVNKRKRKLYLLKAGSIAAVTLLVAIGCWQLFFKPNTGQHESALLAADNKHIELQLANGKTIDLSTAGQQVQLGNMTLNNANKKLSYTSGATIPQLVTLNIPAGKDYTILLADGTEIMLNSATRLQFPSAFSGNTREVSIHGEAFLKVAKQAGKPFLVHLPGNTVRVLGTSFNVNTYDSGQVKVALVEGAVKISTPKDNLVLKPGYQVASNQKGMQVAPFDADEVLSWRKGIYDFYNVPFSEAANVIARWYGIELVIDDPALNKREFTGVIDRNKPVEVFLENMKATNGLNYYIEGETIHIK